MTFGTQWSARSRGIVFGAALAGLSGAFLFGEKTKPIEIRILSSRPDLVSGGDALVEVRTAQPIQQKEFVLRLNGRDVTAVLKPAGDARRFQGLVAGLNIGNNTLQSMLTGKGAMSSTSITVRNYPATGPILSGPHLTPYECRTVESGLGEPLDANCSAAQKIEYFYRTTDGAFKPLPNPVGPRPSDLATASVNARAVPFLVRVESGTINRSIYRIAILDDPKSTVEPWSPGSSWNGKLAVSFGGGAGTQYNQGVNQATAALNLLYLSRGFAHMVSTELVNQQHGNAVLQGETLMMLKEHFMKRYGVPKWTVGNGGSGGAIQQLLITEIYPGLLDGLQPALSFPDSTMHTPDCGLFQNFWRKADPAAWTEAKRIAVEGYTKGTCAAWERTFVPVYTATNAAGCALNNKSLIYNPTTNPHGARCTVQDMRVNIYGRDPHTGHARKPQDNVGLQYGLAALNKGVVTVDEFLDLNEKMGGNDMDGGFIAKRSVGDLLAIPAVYASGLMNSGGGGLANVPILHSRGYTDAIGDIHDRHRDLTIRARLEKSNGRSDNQVIWVGPQPQRSQPRSGADLAALSLDAMTVWLDGIAADPVPLSTSKVVAHKPSEAVDACWDTAGNKIAERASFDGAGRCNELYPVHSEPRLIAGAPLTNDILKCQLKRIDFADYKAGFTEAQKARMADVFPGGVCDFSKPGVGQGPLKGAYQRY